jgi:putative ABC transport system ATP-binding protein
MVTFCGVSKTYETDAGPVLALRPTDLEIQRGEFVAVMGASGSGKSTLLQLMGCLDQPSGGVYRLNGQPVHALSPNQRAAVRSENIGFVFQNYNLLPRTTALENIERALWCDKRSQKSARSVAERARQCLEWVNLPAHGHHFPSQLSGGQQQRVAIARALANAPSLILADEPTGNLDSVAARGILALLKSVHAGGTTVVVVTHDPEVAAQAERILTLRDGVVVSDQTLPRRGSGVAGEDRSA